MDPYGCLCGNAESYSEPLFDFNAVPGERAAVALTETPAEHEQMFLPQVERMLNQLEARLKHHIDAAVHGAASSHAKMASDLHFPTDHSHHSVPVEESQLPERSSHFYGARVPDHFRQMVNDSLRSPVKPSKWGQLGQSVRSASVGDRSFQWDTWRISGSRPSLSSCSAVCEVMTLTLVVAYTILMGITLQLLSSTGQAPVWAQPVDLIFSALFVIDIACRFFIEGRRFFFFGPGARWNTVDCLVVLLILSSQLLSDTGHPHLGSMSVLRLLRILRILGVARLLRFLCRWRAFRYMRTLAASIVETSKSILPLMAFLLAIIYLFGMVLTEGIWESCLNSPDISCEKFGTLLASMMTLFQILYHGILWGPVWDAFGAEAHATWFLRTVFLLFVCFALIVVANVISSFLFALQRQVGDRERDTLIQNEIESKEEFLRSMAMVFRDFDQNGNGAISWTEFELALEDERMLAFLASMGLDISDAIGLFEVLDSDSTGAIEQTEFLLGCLRLRGGAKSIDLVRVQMEQEWMHRALQGIRRTLDDMWRRLPSLQEAETTESLSIIQRSVAGVAVDSNRMAQSFVIANSSPLHPGQHRRTQLLPHERAVTLQELEVIAGLTELARTEGWTSNDGQLLSPHQVNLYHFNYEHILPQTAPEKGVELNSIKLDSGTSIPVGKEVIQSKKPGAVPAAIGIVLHAEQTSDDLVTLSVKIKKGRFTTNTADGKMFIDGKSCTLPQEIICEGSVSYKELLSSAARVPAWYCSHWWGEPIQSFVTCCKRHAHLRGLTHVAGTYWVCGYANRQHELMHEIGCALQDSSFYKALQVADGILLILDPEAKPFSRIWCDYELYAAITDSAKDLDLVTATHSANGHVAMMLSKNFLPQESAVAKSVRERNFPISFLLRGLHVRLEDGEATVTEDKFKILKAIAGTDIDSSKGHMLLEQNLKLANDTLHSTLAVLAWPQAMQRGLLGDMNLAEILAADVGRERLELSLAHFEASCTDSAMKILASGLPPNLQELRLSFEGCNKITDNGVSSLMRHLSPKLKLLYLDFIGCTLLTDASIISLAKHLPASLHELQLHFAGCEGIHAGAVQHLKEHWPPALQQFRGSFKGTGVNRNFRHLQEFQAFLKE